jgi:hypothetical protein
MSISFALFLKTMNDKTYAQNLTRAQLLLTSLVTFCTFPVNLVIVVPSSEQAAAAAVLTSSGNITVSFMNDETLIPNTRYIKTTSWFKAQILKIAYVAQATTDYVLVLDPDVVALRSFAETDLVSSAGIYNNHLIGKRSTVVVYSNALAILAGDLTNVVPPGTAFAKQPYAKQINTKLKSIQLTPAIYQVSEMVLLIAALTAKNITLPQLALTGGFTIESLYSTFTQLNNSFNTTDNDLVGSHFHTMGTTDNSNLWFDPTTGIFGLISSRLNVPANQVISIWRNSVGDLSGLPAKGVG